MTDLLALCYHTVSERWDHPMAVTPARLERHVTSLLNKGYDFGVLTESVLVPHAGRTAAVTFDDGFRDVVRYALPVLERLGVPATVFVPTWFIGTDKPLAWLGFDSSSSTAPSEDLMPMSWADLTLLVAAGWEVGSHSRTHPRLRELGDDELAEELGASREDCERQLGTPCTSLAYPFGDVDDRVAAAARQAGYAVGATLARQAGRANALRTPRICVNRVDGQLRFASKVSRPLRTPAAAAAIGAVHRVRVSAAERGRAGRVPMERR